MEVRGWFVGVGSLLPYGSQGSNSGSKCPHLLSHPIIEVHILCRTKELTHSAL